MNKDKKNVIVLGESMLSNISEIVLSKNHSVKVKELLLRKLRKLKVCWKVNPVY